MFAVVPHCVSDFSNTSYSSMVQKNNKRQTLKIMGEKVTTQAWVSHTNNTFACILLQIARRPRD